MERSPSYKSGLTTAEAEKRLKEYGANEIPEKKKNLLAYYLNRKARFRHFADAI